MAKRRKISKAIRDMLLVEAMHRCCLCPEHHDVTDLHHIVPISEDGPNTEDNLMVICPTCHAKIHRFRSSYTVGQLRMYKERWVRLCALGLPLDVRIAQAFDYTKPPTPPQRNEEQPHLQDLIAIKRRRLWELEKQAALYGITCPPQITLEIEDLRREIAELKAHVER